MGSTLPTARTLPQDLLARVLEAPDDDGPRLVLADALLTANDPRGEFIAIQCALAADDGATAKAKTKTKTPAKLTPAKRKTLERRAQKLLDSRGAQWQAEIGLEEYECMYRRGFIEHVIVAEHMPLSAVLSTARKLSPIRGLEIEGRDAFDALLGNPLVKRLTGLNAANCDVVEKDLRRLRKLNSKLESFTTSAARWGPGDIAVLSEWPSLKSLELFVMPITIKLVEAIVQSSLASRLVKLDLRCSDNVGKKRVAHIVAAAPWPSLEELVLVQHKIDDVGTAALANAPGLDLRTLNLALNEIGNGGAKALAMSSTLSNLHTLDLSFNQTIKAAAVLFASPKNLAALKFLNLSYVSVSRGAKAKLEARFGERGVDL